MGFFAYLKQVLTLSPCGSFILANSSIDSLYPSSTPSDLDVIAIILLFFHCFFQLLSFPDRPHLLPVMCCEACCLEQINS